MLKIASAEIPGKIIEKMLKKGVTFDTAAERFDKNLCPCCGKRMEQRGKSQDCFCHRCHQAWSAGNVLTLRRQFKKSEQGEPASSGGKGFIQKFLR